MQKHPRNDVSKMYINLFSRPAGIRVPEQLRGSSGEAVRPPGDDPAGSRVRRARGNARKTAGVLRLHRRWASSLLRLVWKHF